MLTILDTTGSEASGVAADRTNPRTRFGWKIPFLMAVQFAQAVEASRDPFPLPRNDAQRDRVRAPAAESGSAFGRMLLLWGTEG